MELWSNKTHNNAQYIWKILRIEQQRLSEEVDQYEDMIAVNALQAITIYFLLRVSAQNDEDADFDVPLIQTMTKLWNRVRGITMKHCDPSSLTRPSWGSWVAVESLRRTIAALLIIEFLFDFSPGMGKASCNSTKIWSKMLLPGAKQLWEAKTRSDWEREYRALGNDQRPLYGELLKHDHLNSVRGGLLDRWMAQVDEFGTVVINVASVSTEREYVRDERINRRMGLLNTPGVAH